MIINTKLTDENNIIDLLLGKGLDVHGGYSPGLTSLPNSLRRRPGHTYLNLKINLGYECLLKLWLIQLTNPVIVLELIYLKMDVFVSESCDGIRVGDILSGVDTQCEPFYC